MTHYNNSNTLKWNMDDGYPNTVREKILLDVVPARIDGVGYNNRLSIMLNFYLNNFKTCGSIFPHGFLVSNTKLFSFCYYNNYFIVGTKILS